MAKRKISRAGARRKGHNFEREVAAYFRQIGFLGAGRELEYQAHKVRGVDVEKTGPFHSQCKCLQKYAPITCIGEIKHSAGIPVLFTKGNGLAPMAVIPMEAFFKMAEVYMRDSKNADWTDPRNLDLGF